MNVNDNIAPVRLRYINACPAAKNSCGNPNPSPPADIVNSDKQIIPKEVAVAVPLVLNHMLTNTSAKINP